MTCIYGSFTAIRRLPKEGEKIIRDEALSTAHHADAIPASGIWLGWARIYVACNMRASAPEDGPSELDIARLGKH